MSTDSELSPRGVAPAARAGLSGCELELLSLFAAGFDMSLVRPLTGLQPSAINGYLQSIYVKLGACSARQAIALGYSRGLLRVT
ncbi:MAG: hypothetical protein HY329_04965 [Chloroflexi bacterium]|nr:hypothetical protein [Chloroflexota bacterium]